MFKDPVCGMDVDPRKSTYRFDFRGQTYYFCSEDCLSQFKSSPEQYMGKQMTMGGDGGKHEHIEEHGYCGEGDHQHHS